MALIITSASVAAACASANSQIAWMDALLAPWDGLSVTARIEAAGGVVRETLTLAPWRIDTSGATVGVRPGLRTARTHTSVGSIAKLVFAADGVDIFELDAGVTGSGASVTFAQAIKALCRPKLDAVLITAPTGLPKSEFAAGSITSISVNTREGLNPTDDPLANPNFPSVGPWFNGTTWSSVSAYCGSLYASRLGTRGSLMEWAGAGHSAVNALFWLRFDVASRTWQRHGPRTPPTNGLAGFTGNWTTWKATGFNAAFDEVRGDWDANSSLFPAAFRQDIGRVPEGCHSRNSYVYRPPRLAGNATGQIHTAWHATGVQSGTGVSMNHSYDPTTERWTRHSVNRQGHGSSAGAMVYFPTLDRALVPGTESTSAATFLDVLNCSTGAWSRVTGLNAGARNFRIDATGFAWIDRDGNPWYVYCEHLVQLSPSFNLWAIRADVISSGTVSPWVDLTVSADSYPTDGTDTLSGVPGYSFTVQFAHCPLDGRYYATNRKNGSNKLWRLAPPTSGVITDTWTLTEQTLTGSLSAMAANNFDPRCFDYSRLQWAGAIGAFLWHDDRPSGPVQAIVPAGIY